MLQTKVVDIIIIIIIIIVVVVVVNHVLRTHEVRHPRCVL